MSIETKPWLPEDLPDVLYVVQNGFFYRTNNRGLPGLDWGNNLTLPLEIRKCPHSIAIPEHRVADMARGEHMLCEVHAERKEGKVWLGDFRIYVDTLWWWESVNGYYTTKDGRRILAVPCPALWHVLEVPKKEKKGPEDQLKIFT